MPKSDPLADRFARAASAKPKPAGAQRADDSSNFTVALSNAQRRELRIWALDHRTEASSVIRSLLAEMAEDPALEARVAARCAAAKAAGRR
jgi:hypothetical protein